MNFLVLNVGYIILVFFYFVSNNKNQIKWDVKKNYLFYGLIRLLAKKCFLMRF